MKSTELRNDNYAFISIVTVKPLINIRYVRFTIKIEKNVENKGCIVQEVMCKGTIDGTSCSLVFNIIALPSTCDTLASSH